MPSAPLRVALRSDLRYRLTAPRTLYLGGVRAPNVGGLRPYDSLPLVLTLWLSAHSVKVHGFHSFYRSLSGRLSVPLGGASAPMDGTLSSAARF